MNFHNEINAFFSTLGLDDRMWILKFLYNVYEKQKN